MKTINHRSKYLYIGLFILLSTLIFIIGLPQFVSGQLPFIPGYDIRFLHRPFYSEFQTILTNSIKFSALPFWSWNHFFGNNYWAGKIVYVLGDFYNYLTLGINQHYYVILLIQFYLKVLVAGITFFFYGLHRKWKLETIVLGSLMFAFSSWMMKYTEQPVFISFYSLVPFYFLAIESFFENKAKYLLPIVATVLVIMNYYLFYTLSFFTVIYVVYRAIEERITFKRFVRLVLMMIAYFLLGVLLSSFVILPALDFILQNPRINVEIDMGILHTDPKIFLHLLIGLFVPSSTFISGLNSVFETGYYPTREIMLWASSLNVLLLIQSAFVNDRWYRNLNRAFIVIMILLMSPIGGSILNGLNYTSFRWSYLLIFMSVMISMQFLNHHSINRKSLLLGILYYIVGLILVTLILPLDLQANTLQIVVFTMTLALLILTAYALSRNLNYRVLMGILVVELTLSLFVTFQTPYFNQLSWDDVNGAESVLGKKNELMNFLYEKEGGYSFFRVYAPFDSIYWYSSLNMNLIYGTMDVKTYDSTYQPSSAKLRDVFGVANHIDWYYDIKDPRIINLSSVKYAVVTDESELPHNRFEFFTNYKGLLVFRNLNFLPYLRTVSSVYSIGEFKLMETPPIETMIIADLEDVDTIKDYIQSNIEYRASTEMIFQNMIISNLSNSESSFAVTSIAFDKGWRVTVNNVNVETFNINGGFIGFNVPAGGGEVKMYFMPIGFKTGFVISTLSFGLLILLVLFDKKIKVMHNLRSKS